MFEAFHFMALALGPGAAFIQRPPRAPAEAQRVLAFWRQAGPSRWFAKDHAFDRGFREGFLTLHEQAVAGDLEDWLTTAEGALALVLLLDQFPRNAFRGTPRMYASDPLAREMARRAIAVEHDRDVALEERKFFYLPFGHSEAIADQRRSVIWCKRLDPVDAKHAQHHHDIIARFGRFPHRNPILGRPMTPQEQAYLDAGGYVG